MLTHIFNNRFILVFIIPFFLGSLTILSFQPFNLTIINFLIFPFFFYIVSYINKKSKNTYRKKPFLVNSKTINTISKIYDFFIFIFHDLIPKIPSAVRAV